MTTMTVAEARAIEPVSPAEAEQAEQEALEAVRLVEALEERVRQGDETLSPAEIATQRDAADFAKLRADSVRRKVEQSRDAARLRILGDLADAMRTRTSEDAAIYGRLLAAIEDAVTDLVTYTETRDAAINDWRRVMHEQDVAHGPGGHGRAQPEHNGRVGWSDNGDRSVYVDGEILAPLEPGVVVLAALHRARQGTGHVLRSGPSGSEFRLPDVGPQWVSDPAGQIAKAT
jgi:hypothetical protein